MRHGITFYVEHIGAKRIVRACSSVVTHSLLLAVVIQAMTETPPQELQNINVPKACSVTLNSTGACEFLQSVQFYSQKFPCFDNNGSRTCYFKDCSSDMFLSELGGFNLYNLLVFGVIVTVISLIMDILGSTTEGTLYLLRRKHFDKLLQLIGAASILASASTISLQYSQGPALLASFCGKCGSTPATWFSFSFNGFFLAHTALHLTSVFFVLLCFLMLLVVSSGCSPYAVTTMVTLTYWSDGRVDTNTSSNALSCLYCCVVRLIAAIVAPVMMLAFVVYSTFVFLCGILLFPFYSQFLLFTTQLAIVLQWILKVDSCARYHSTNDEKLLGEEDQ